MKVLVIGGGGLIGQAIVKEHLKHKDEVYIIDNQSNIYNDYSKLKGIDITDEVYATTLPLVLKKYKFDIISDQAAYVSVGESQYNIAKYINNNIGHTADLLDAILKSKCFPEKLILAGSMGPYGEGRKTYFESGCNHSWVLKDCRRHMNSLLLSLPNKEDQELYPISFYAISKQTQEQMFRVFCETYGIAGFSLRYFSVYGLKSNPNNPQTGVLSVIVNKFLNSDIVELNEDGSQLRDLIRNTECARAHFLASKAITSSFNSINIATGVSHSLLHIAQEIKTCLKSDKQIYYNKQYRQGDIKDSIADVSKAKAILGFESKNTVTQDIQAYCKYILKNKEKFITSDTCKEADKNLIKFGLFK